MKTINTSSIFNDHLVDSRKNLLMRLQEKAQLSIEMPKRVRKMAKRVRKTSGEWEKC
jgi:hypothetical protein